jgi:hypothetical protein
MEEEMSAIRGIFFGVLTGAALWVLFFIAAFR